MTPVGNGSMTVQKIYKGQSKHFETLGIVIVFLRKLQGYDLYVHVCHAKIIKDITGLFHVLQPNSEGQHLVAMLEWQCHVAIIPYSSKESSSVWP